MSKAFSATRWTGRAAAVAFFLAASFSSGAQAQADRAPGTSDQDDGGAGSNPSLQTLITDGNGTIRNSLCVGSDCANAETHGFDTIKIKENNTYILFDDTSSTASFASNDWALIANEAENGGRNLFAIRDATANRNLFTVEAGAPDNAFLLDDNGNLGIGLPTGQSPLLELHVADGNTPTLRLDQTNQDGFTPQIFDIAVNEANFFVRDVTNGSNLVFRIKPGAPEDSLFIESDGNVGLGTDSPQARLHVVGDARIDGSIYQLSSRSVKTDFETVEPDSILDRLAGLDLGAWQYLEGSDRGRHFGPAAEDFHAAFGLGESNQRISLSDMAGIALGAAQALQQEIDQRDREIETLRARLDRLEQALLENSTAHGES